MEWSVVLRLLLAMFLGGVIGLERELVNRPAGFRTHTLVCLGSALIMVISEALFQRYHHLANLDPARLGAAVVSGIGFLGAGTIMKDGHRIEGLTTAASLWVVGCIGLAIGAGLYAGGIVAFALVSVTLVSLRRLERLFFKKKGLVNIAMTIADKPGQLAKVTDVMGRFKVQIRDIDMVSSDEDLMEVVFLVSVPPGADKNALLDELRRLDGTKEVTIS
ncbi:MAG: MgtC/SapB family protein [Bacillota bacterium]|jgi:putative Mg2+ transporter-C (MgtC) family protein|nr:MgtC/SapB family protein [Candidatus Fermentithermobacillaceae bacterium]